MGVAGGRHQGNRNDDDTDVHDHPTVRTSDEAVQTLTPCGEHELAKRRTGRKATEAEGHQRRQPVRTDEQRDHYG